MRRAPALTSRPLASQNTQLVETAAPNPWLDLLFQLSYVVTDISWGCLALYLLWLAGMRMRDIGLDADQQAARQPEHRQHHRHRDRHDHSG